jgi:hypothetical protein
MQVFVRRSALSQKSDTVAVLAYFDDATMITPDMHPPGSTLLSLDGVVQLPIGGVTLAPGWREANAARILNAEAERRIAEVFPEREQLASLADVLSRILKHGADSAGWPKEATARSAEFERAWAYAKSVRRTAEAKRGALPPDPTADEHWPKRAAPYKAD